MIFISMQGADGSSSAFVNNINTDRKKGSKKTWKSQTNGRILTGFVVFSLWFSYKIKHMTCFCSGRDQEQVEEVRETAYPHKTLMFSHTS